MYTIEISEKTRKSSNDFFTAVRAAQFIANKLQRLIAVYDQYDQLQIKIYPRNKAKEEITS